MALRRRSAEASILALEMASSRWAILLRSTGVLDRRFRRRKQARAPQHLKPARILPTRPELPLAISPGPHRAPRDQRPRRSARIRQHRPHPRHPRPLTPRLLALLLPTPPPPHPRLRSRPNPRRQGLPLQPDHEEVLRLEECPRPERTLRRRVSFDTLYNFPSNGKSPSRTHSLSPARC